MKPNDLDKAARSELRTLSKENADAVARHLVMAGRLVEDDAEEAHRHALAAGRRAGRVAVVRETLAITAYATGDFALALRELRTFRRISGSDDQIGLMVDSERGVGRPDRALELGRSVDRSVLPVEAQVALAIAMSGARLDLADARGALDELEHAPVDLQRVHPWSSTLFESLAAVHEDLGDADAAALWRRRAERADALLDEVGEEATTVEVDTEYLPVEPGEPDGVEVQEPGQGLGDVDGIDQEVEIDGIDPLDAPGSPAEPEPGPDDASEEGPEADAAEAAAVEDENRGGSGRLRDVEGSAEPQEVEEVEEPEHAAGSERLDESGQPDGPAGHPEPGDAEDASTRPGETRE